MSSWLVGLGLCSALAGGQAADTAALPAGLRTHLQDERFGIVTSIRGLPLGVRDGLQRLFGSQTLDIAEPSGDFERSGVIVSSLVPTRRLAVAGCSNDHCLVYYQRRGNVPTWHLALFHWTPALTKFEWGGSAPPDLATLDAVRKAMLSGVIKGGTKVW